MRKGYLSQYFERIAAKRLSIVEADPTRSHQHEFNGTTALKLLFGEDRIDQSVAKFIWLDSSEDTLATDGIITWYDARERHPTRSEFRLYFTNNAVMEMASAGDLIIIAKTPQNEYFLFLTEAGSAYENQLIWLFGLHDEITTQFNFVDIEMGLDKAVSYAVRYILSEIGVELKEELEESLLEHWLEPYISTRKFPTTSEFSALARRTAPIVSPIEDPDGTLITWMEHEEKLFRRLERHVVTDRLQQGFTHGNEIDVEGFIQFSLSVQNRRKSRVGHALENHLNHVFESNQIRRSKTVVTELNSKPDFLFPGIEEYKNTQFPVEKLTVLGVKSTCKDRWRQVLVEAKRIEAKHLLTLELGISENQTLQMQENKLQLVLPKPLFVTYTPSQQDWLMDLTGFIRLVRQRQN